MGGDRHTNSCTCGSPTWAVQTRQHLGSPKAQQGWRLLTRTSGCCRVPGTYIPTPCWRMVEMPNTLEQAEEIVCTCTAGQVIIVSDAHVAPRCTAASSDCSVLHPPQPSSHPTTHSTLAAAGRSRACANRFYRIREFAFGSLVIVQTQHKQKNVCVLRFGPMHGASIPLFLGSNQVATNHCNPRSSVDAISSHTFSNFRSLP